MLADTAGICKDDEMRAIVLCSKNEFEFSNELLDLVPNIDDYKLIDPVEFPKREGMLRLPDVVIAVVDTANPDEKQIGATVRVADFLSNGNAFHPIAIALGSTSLPEEIALKAWSFAYCADRSHKSVQDLALTVSYFLSMDEEIGPLLRKERVNATLSGIRSFATDGVRLVLALVFSFTPVAALKVYENAIANALLDVLPGEAAHFVYLLAAFSTSLLSALFMVWLITPVLRRFINSRYERMRVEENTEAMRYSKRLRRVVQYEAGDEGPMISKSGARRMDALERMLVNLEDIKQYYTWSQDQARSAFRLAEVLCVVGFLFLAAAAFLPLILGGGWETSIVPTVGGAVTELVAGTALFVYKSSVEQLNHYHDALHEDERFLSGVSLVDRFSTPERQDEILTEIVRSELAMNLAAAHAGGGGKGSDGGASSGGA